MLVGKTKIGGIALTHRPAQRKAPVREFFDHRLHPQRHAIALVTKVERKARTLPSRMTSGRGFGIIHWCQHRTLCVLADQFREQPGGIAMAATAGIVLLEVE